MMNDELRNREKRSATEAAVLWVGLLLPPVAWALQMQILYWMVRGACARSSNVALFLVTLIAVVLVLISAVCAWLGWRSAGQKWPSGFGDVISRQRFMAVLGLFTAGTFLLVIIAQGIATIVFHPCQL